MKRLADPYHDLAVIDSRAPRFNQATIGLLSALAVALDWWWLLGILAAQLVVGLTLGRRFCLPCLAYFELVQPRFGEGPIEDARPPRFANVVGALFVLGATAWYGAGLEVVGASLGGLVAGLALLAAATGFCTGCEAYKLGSLLIGRPAVTAPKAVVSQRQPRSTPSFHALCRRSLRLALSDKRPMRSPRALRAGTLLRPECTAAT